MRGRFKRIYLIRLGIKQYFFFLGTLFQLLLCHAGDDENTLKNFDHVSQTFIDEISNAFADAAQRGVTICIASGDTGSDSKVGDGKAHVQYPATDPWVLSVGGTAIGEVNGSDLKEYVWNDDSGATGGGISDYFTDPPKPPNPPGIGSIILNR